MNSLDKLNLQIPIKKDIKALNAEIDVYFGVELNFMSPRSDFVFSPEIKEKYGFQFTIGGIHNCYTDSLDLTKYWRFSTHGVLSS